MGIMFGILPNSGRECTPPPQPHPFLLQQAAILNRLAARYPTFAALAGSLYYFARKPLKK
jgi:hypothetical protein